MSLNMINLLDSNLCLIYFKFLPFHFSFLFFSLFSLLGTSRIRNEPSFLLFIIFFPVQ